MRLLERQEIGEPAHSFSTSLLFMWSEYGFECSPIFFREANTVVPNFETDRCGRRANPFAFFIKLNRILFQVPMNDDLNFPVLPAFFFHPIKPVFDGFE